MVPPTNNQLTLINEIEGQTLLNNRYENIFCVNGKEINPRGVLSLVFQAYDKVEDKFVALKFMDPDRISDLYRMKSFEREPQLLRKLEGKKRVIQIHDDIDHFKLVVPIGPNNSIDILYKYFSTEWIEGKRLMNDVLSHHTLICLFFKYPGNSTS